MGQSEQARVRAEYSDIEMIPYKARAPQLPGAAGGADAKSATDP